MLTRLAKNRRTVLLLAVLWVSLVGLSWLFPYTGDDWAWGSSIGLERLSSLFADYNGRYVGNLVVLAMTRSLPVRCVVMASVLTGIVYEVYALSGRRHFSTLLASAVLVMLVHYRVGAQAVVWTSGFANYAVSALVVLLYLRSCMREASDEARGLPQGARCAGMAMLGFAGSLIIENVTIFNVMASACFVVYCKVSRKRWSAAHAAFMMGSLAGAAVMFSNGAYWAVVAGTDEYRSLATEAGEGPVERLASIVPLYLVAYCWPVFACMALSLGSWALSPEWRDVPRRQKIASYVLLEVVVAALAFSLYSTFFASGSPGLLRNAVGFALLVLLVFALVAFSVIGRRGEGETVVLAVLICMALLVGPLLFVNPIGPRNFFLTYILECVVAARVWDECAGGGSRIAGLLLAAVLVAVFVRWCDVYWDVRQADVERNAAVQAAAQKGKSSVKVEKLPCAGYVHTPDPTDGIWEERYKLFYGLPDSLDITVK